MTGFDVLKIIGMIACLVCSGWARAQDNATVSARQLADAYINSTSDPALQGFKDAHSAKYGHFLAFYYFEDMDLGDGWRGGRGGPVVFVDTEKMSVAGVMMPSRPVFVGRDMSDELAANVISYFRRTVPEFDLANYDFSVVDAGEISYLYVARKYRDRGIYRCNCALLVEKRTNDVVGSVFSVE